ncbi:sporulation associated protein [Aspergillus niger]|uniref:T6SS phospholipase effector Tle1-like catalytic domain-containing protein n=1 Tax=Aspergillus lacticoffeatus (strain CBS 101883) TaxID=1450533 RepID=UPI000D7F44DB|nr:uncharacterized protein BO96DRAFT_350598 [Aspergillus niger CBS 101883]PYH51260.1 hypothetical protein BO96DRAFT_350598 [Aspergillus niger CBS 101883]GJP91488.1 sporulation associated protein [Aspergillus niger]
MEATQTPYGPARVPKHFVLCFDGTGNKFSGDQSDSNVLKIFRMLDRSKSHQFHYYQPGIGTYVTSKSLSSHGRIQKIKSAYFKAKDSAVGSSFDEHVMGGYKFLMRYYQTGDDIYFIGFSRGSYIARFLAEMLDYIGLLEAGNEELVRFAWETFAKWQQRRDDNKEEKEEKKKLFRYMKAFRETFSRPISRIKFMGLFDTVNSVPRFESAWMERSKFPYTARSSALVIRHAVSIDERRAKFRQDLISEIRPWHDKKHPIQERGRQYMQHLRHPLAGRKNGNGNVPVLRINSDNIGTDDGAPPAKHDEEETASVYRSAHASHENLHDSHPYRASNLAVPGRSLNLAVPIPTESTEDLSSIRSGQSGQLSLNIQLATGQFDEEDERKQDIQEVWFPGCHADIGGGWKRAKGEAWPLSHAPLVWMVQEAKKAGLQFDPKKLKQFECDEEYDGEYTPINEHSQWHPRHEFCRDPIHNKAVNGQHMLKLAGDERKKDASAPSNRFHDALVASSTDGFLHDCLEFNAGLPALSVISWRIMEYLPFRRMDLQTDGSWKPIRWPLPCGEVRDIPDDAQIHVSALRRMQTNPNYRPGNLIKGGGGRGVKVAPKELGIGQWELKAHGGDLVRETYVRKKNKDATMCEDECHH